MIIVSWKGTSEPLGDKEWILGTNVTWCWKSWLSLHRDRDIVDVNLTHHFAKSTWRLIMIQPRTKRSKLNFLLLLHWRGQSMFELVSKYDTARSQEGLTWAGTRNLIFPFGTAVCRRPETLSKTMNGWTCQVLNQSGDPQLLMIQKLHPADLIIITDWGLVYIIELRKSDQACEWNSADLQLGITWYSRILGEIRKPMILAPLTEPSSDLFGICLEIDITLADSRHGNRILQGGFGPSMIAVATLERRMGRAVPSGDDVLRTKVAASSANSSERQMGGSCRHPC
jgi:hypothetical protein